MTDDQATSNVMFGEYKNKNGVGRRVPWAKTLTGAESIATILGANYQEWTDAKYMDLSAG